MLNDDLLAVLQSQEILRNQLEPFSKAMEAITQSQQMMQVTQDINRFHELARVAFGPFEELRRRADYMNVALQSIDEFQQMRNLVLAAEKQFDLPGITDAMKLFRQFENSTLANVMKRYQVQRSELQRSFEAMRSSWLDTKNDMLSINGFVALQGIGRALSTMRPFGRHLTEALRIDLGDWRKKIIWPSYIATDPFIRTSLYAQQGFNPDLTTFPYPAFEEIVTEAGLRVPDIPGAEGYDIDGESDDVERESAFKRTNSAHDLLQRFESQLRRFIDEQMETTFGANWTKHRIPGDMRSLWHDKQRQDPRAQKWPMISYADFTDYAKIIAQKDNWRDLFKAAFVNKSSVQESFQRIYPIRLATMHARPITQDDELYLYVETKRILSAIGINT